MATKEYDNSKAWQRFLQQDLKTVKPIITPYIGMAVVGGCLIVAFILGGIFTALSINSIKYEKRYDDVCQESSMCTISFDIDQELSGDLMLRYKLTHYYQNHRRFEESRSLEQLMGNYMDYDGMSDCSPLRSVNSSEAPENWLLPCGLSALYFFNDTYQVNDPNLLFNDTDIAWSEDVDIYKHLNNRYTTGIRWLESYTDFQGGQTNEHFIVWMRTSALPTIIKNYAKCKDCTIPAGTTLNITIGNNYPTTIFEGEKYIVLETDSVLGTKNLFLGISYIVLGCILFLFLICMILERIIRSRKIGDMSLILEFNNSKPAISISP